MSGRPYTSVRLLTEVRDALQVSALTLSAQVGRRLTISEVVQATNAVANQHPEELRAALATPTEPKGTDE